MPAPRANYHHGDLPNALVRTALRLIGRGGIAALSLREVAKRAGVSASAVYRHYADKEALLAAVAAEGFGRLNAAFVAALAAAPRQPRARLVALGQAYAAFALGHPEQYRLMFGNGRTDSRDERLVAEARQSFRHLEEAVAATLGRAADEPAVIAGAVAAWSLVHGYAMLRLDGRLDDLPPDRVPDISRVLDRLVTG
ncbi:MAG TPA: TetR/AcrR family transcriptional regulator [Candidatus Sulfotelmatobacter sp.]|nr:TetR/AcrR family transcriptional regulator [Candidatus Sulfotelmatobacter sp.]